MEITVREASIDDGEDLLELWHGFTGHLSEFNDRYAAKDGADERWLSYFENQLVDSKYSAVMLAEDASGEPVGVLEVRIVGEHPIFQLGRHGEIFGMFVEKRARGHGVGRALLDAAETWLGDPPRGVDFYRMEVIHGDDEAAAALGGMGLDPVTHTYEGQT